MKKPQIAVLIRNSAEPGRSWRGLCRISAGSFDSMIPGKHLRELGLKPKGTRRFKASDGSEIELEATSVELEILGEFAGGTAIFGPDDAEPILGMSALESVGIEVDPRTQRLKRQPSVRLKSARRR